MSKSSSPTKKIGIAFLCIGVALLALGILLLLFSNTAVSLWVILCSILLNIVGINLMILKKNN